MTDSGEMSDIWISTHLIDREVTNSVDMVLRLKDETQRKRYEHFTVSTQTVTSLLAMNIFLTIFSFPQFVLVGNAIRYEMSDEELGHNVAILVSLVLLITICWYHYSYFIQKPNHLWQLEANDLQKLHRVLCYGFVAMNVLMCYRHIAKTILGPCRSDIAFRETWHCTDLDNDRAIVAETSMIVMLIPIMYATVVRGAYIEVSLTLWTMSIGSLIFSMAYRGAINSILFVVYYAVGSLMILVSARRQSFFLFFSHSHLQTFLMEKERQAEVLHSEELRHMVGNVAHDLKTVS